ncbi:MAG: hypothetical protein RL701_4907 [Pseudomonadota bacterium]|jgi:hypothetical protein
MHKTSNIVGIMLLLASACSCTKNPPSGAHSAGSASPAAGANVTVPAGSGGILADPAPADAGHDAEVLDGSVFQACTQVTDAGALYCCGRASEIPGITCIDRTQDGGEYGIYGRCREVGEDIERKVVGARCCDGAVAAGLFAVVLKSQDYPTGCMRQGPPSLAVCLACGNGNCEADENRCNCDKDCRE